jgi:hypothetical protein
MCRQATIILPVVRARPLHKQCQGKQIEQSTQSCCNCNLKLEEQPHPSIHRVSSHGKEKMQRKRKPIASNRGIAGRTCSSKYVLQGQSAAPLSATHCSSPNTSKDSWCENAGPPANSEAAAHKRWVIQFRLPA